MSNEETGADGIAGSWNRYWRGTPHGRAYTGEGGTHPLIRSFWAETFAKLSPRHRDPLIIDVASGNGALLDAALAAFGAAAHIVCIDISTAAVHGLRRGPGVTGVVGDARRLPVASGACDVVVSQFGVEYAGEEALAEAARVSADGGSLVLLLHHRESPIFRQCATDLAAVRELQEAQFLPLASKLFDAGFAAIEGGDQRRYRAAADEMSPAVRTLESLIRRYGPRVADDMLSKLYRDVRTMHERMRGYQRAEVLGWLEGMQYEIAAYAGRMAAMCDAALNQHDFDRVGRALRQCGFLLERHEALLPGDERAPLAWVAIAGRPAGS